MVFPVGVAFKAVIPAKAGIQAGKRSNEQRRRFDYVRAWIPAFAGMTIKHRHATSMPYPPFPIPGS